MCRQFISFIGSSRMLGKIFNMEINVLKNFPKGMGCLCWSHCLDSASLFIQNDQAFICLIHLYKRCELWIWPPTWIFFYYGLQKAWLALRATLYQCLTDQAFSCLIHFFKRCVSDLRLPKRRGHKSCRLKEKLDISRTARATDKCLAVLETRSGAWSNDTILYAVVPMV